MRLLGHHPLNGFGNCGEGLALQKTRDGRRVLWIAHESQPKNVTALDVTNPKKPALITQTDLPHEKMRSNSLDLVGDLLIVAYQTSAVGLKPAGFEIFDVADPAKPKSVVFFDASGPASRGVHHLWWVDGEYVHVASGAPDFTPRNPKDDQCYRIIDVREPTRPREVGRWWLPGTREGDPEPVLPRHPRIDSGYRAHNTNVYPRRPDRAYVGYLDGGACILDIADKAHPRLLGRWDYHPPFQGFCHTVLPLFDKNLLVVTDESVRPAAADWPKLVWIVDASVEEKLVSISLTLGDENPLGLWICPVAVGVPALHRHLTEAHRFQHHGKLVLVVPPQPMRPQFRLRKVSLSVDLMTHPDVLDLLDAVGYRGFVDEDGGPIRGAHP